MDALAVQVGGSSPRLRAWASSTLKNEDLHDPAHTALAVNPLVAGRLSPSPPASNRSGHRQPCPLLTAWGGPTHGPENTGTSTSS